MRNNYTTVEYRSNLQPYSKENERSEKGYLSHIHDPFALEALRKYLYSYGCDYHLSEIQEKEIKDAAEHCVYAYENDYPWGTISVNGKPVVVCKCTNHACAHFSQCRSGLSAWKDDEYDLDIPEFESPDYSKDKEVGKIFIQKLTESNRKSFQDDTTCNVEEQLSFLPDKDNNIDTDVASEQKTDNNQNAAIDPKQNIEGNPSVISFNNWMKQIGKESNYIQFYESNLKAVDMLAHNHKLWDGPLTGKNKDEANALIESFRNLKVSGREKIMKQHLLQVIDLFETYLNDIEIAKEKPKSAADIDEGKSTIIQKGNNNIEDNLNILIKEKGKTQDIIEIEPPHGQSTSRNHTTGIPDLDQSEIIPRAGSSNIHCQSNNKPLSFEHFDSVEQRDIIIAPASEKIIVNAGPGTGKTYTLIARIINMIQEQGLDPDGILVLCFSRAAVEVIEQRLEQAYKNGEVGINWHSVEIRTFDSFATSILAWAIEEDKDALLNESFSLQGMDYDARILAAKELLKNDPDVISQCEHFIVDEVQDLVSVRADFVEQIITDLPEECGYTLLGDACQSIYDYQMRSGQTSSEDYYRWLFSSQKKAHLVSLDINYRQTTELENIGEQFRNTILTGDVIKMEHGLENAKIKIENTKELNLKHPDPDIFYKIMGNDTLAILTRTNGQALLVSTWLRTANVPHKVQKRLADHEYDRWIADIFYDYPNDTITYDEFAEYVQSNFRCTENRCDSLWNALIQAQSDKNRKRYYIDELLHGIVINGKNKELYTKDDSEKITISNIHRSKGREFDHVILLDDIFGGSEQENNAEEYRVAYVALTRAKKELLKTELGPQYIYLDKGGDRRAYKNIFNRRKKPMLSDVEIGRHGDLDLFSMASPETQRIIQDLDAGTRVILRRNKEKSDNNGFITYEIHIEDSENNSKIGYTSMKFAHELERISRKVYNIPKAKDVFAQVYPAEFTNLFVENVITVIAPFNPEATGAKKYGSMMIWRGISLSGFGKTYYEQY